MSMSTLPQQQDEKDATISFRCSPSWKNEVKKRLIDMDKTVEQAAIEALSTYTGVPLPSEQQDAA